MTTVGILGGGQLGQMLALSGIPLGIQFAIYSPQASDPAASLGQFFPMTDHHEHLDDFLKAVDVVTFEHENIPVSLAETLSTQKPLLPNVASLKTAQDRLLEKTLFDTLRIETVRYQAASTDTDIAAAMAALEGPVVVKTTRGGFDGRGQCVIHDPKTIQERIQPLPPPFIVESLVNFKRELSILAVRSQDGDIVYYPVVESHHKDGILQKTITPAPNLSKQTEQLAQTYIAKIMNALDHVGVLALELFETPDTLLANEIAPRVHNTGHWSLGCDITSQFENHIRAITGLPLGNTHSKDFHGMLNLIGEMPKLSYLLKNSSIQAHLYHKAPRPKRKLGHLNIHAPSEQQVQEELNTLAALID